MIRNWLPLVFLLITATASSQTLFTYGDQRVTVPEFLKAYNKNNVPSGTTKAMSVREYLDLYINSRLKIKEAYARGYDTLPHIKGEVENLRNQIIENYMSDPETMDRLLKEAFKRSQVDIHAGHIYIPITNNDTSVAYQRAQAVYNRLQKGEDFLKVAKETSEDPAVKINGGDIGWITVFTLPYHFENSIYALATGKHSTPVRSKAGYHIFKKLGERKAAGKMKAKHILLAFPPDVDPVTKKQLARKADSLYNRLMAGDSFDKLATQFSNDYLTAVTGGNMPDFGIGQYDPVFESKAWALAKDDAITKPFETKHGYHIVKRIKRIPVVTDPANKLNEQELIQRINLDQRWKSSREVLYNKVIKVAGFKRSDFDNAVWWAYTDSILDRRPAGIGRAINPDTHVFSLGDSAVRANEWIVYAQAYRMKPDGSGRKPYEEVMDEYQRHVAMQYYREHLEMFNDEFRYQMEEFKDGNLFFEIMQQEIWNRAHSDSNELKALYEANKQKYYWTKSADAVVFFCADEESSKKLYDQVKKNPSRWKEHVDMLAEKVVADSGRFEWSQIPNKNKMVPVNGMITTPVVNTTDHTSSFAYIVKTYPQSMPRTFNEAKGHVINDYQALLEEEWIKKLKQKYPVKVDEKVLSSIKE
jgi:peptidyl-prolyl cis-trans isomerase SurA